MDISKIKDNLVRLNNALKKAQDYNIDPRKDGIPSSIKLINFKEKRKEHYHNVIKNCFEILTGDIDKIDKGELNLKSNLNNTERYYLDGKVEEALKISDKILGIIENLNNSDTKNTLDADLKTNLPLEIKREIESDFKEIKKCFNAGCYKSVIILCGRILEIALHRKYYDATQIDILEKSPDIGLGNLVAKLKEKDVKLDPGISQQIHLINQLRVFSVHKKKDEFNPSKEQSHAMVLYTVDVLSKLF